MSNPNQPATNSANEFDINESAYKTSHAAIRKARRFALQGLYEWLMTDHRFDQIGQRDWKANAPHDIAARTRANNAMHTVHLGYYHELMRDIPEQINALDALISQHLDRDIQLIDPIEHAILLIGTYELQSRLEIPYKVVLDEAMKLNTHFGATDAHKLINAVLDKLTPKLRSIEVAADTKRDHSDAKDKGGDSDRRLDSYSDHSNKSNVNVVTKTNGSSASAAAPKRTSKPRLGRKSDRSQLASQKRMPPSSSAPSSIETKKGVSVDDKSTPPSSDMS